MRHTTENSFGLKIALIGAIVLLLVSGVGRQVVEHYSSDITEEIQTTIESQVNTLTDQF